VAPARCSLHGDAVFQQPARATDRAWRHAIEFPRITMRKEIATDGGLMSYGMNNDDFYRQAGIYTGQILKGAKPRRSPGSAAN